MEGAASSQSALLFTMGMSAYLGFLHAWLWRRADPAHVWVAIWCFLAVAYQGSRLVQFHAVDAQVAVSASRATFAFAPLLVASLACFARTLQERPLSRFALAVFAPSLAMAILALATPLFVPGRTEVRVDWFGESYLGTVVSPVAAILVPMIAAAIAYVVHSVLRSPWLRRRERVVLLGSLGVYAAMGVASVFSAMRWVPIPTTAEFGPIVVALGLNYLLVHRHRRLQDRLVQMVDERTTRLAQSEARYRELVENAPMGVLACDASGQLTAINRRLLEIMGSPQRPEEVQCNLLESPALIRAGVADVLRRSMEADSVVASEHRYTSEWDVAVDIRLTAAPLHGSQGELTGALGMVEDIGERKALEGRLRQSQRLESVGQLAAGLAHEINNPLAYVRANLTLLQKEWEGLRQSLPTRNGEEPIEEGEALIEESLEGVDRVAGIVRDMRDFSRAADEDRSPCDLDALAESAVRMATTWRRADTRIEEHYGKPPPVPGAAGQLRQVLLNLIVNALQAVGRGGRISLTTGREGEHAVVRIEDDGCGIREEHMERLFDPFFTTKPAGEGTGLGLYVSYEIVRSHGGEIRVESEEGRGATFELRLPLSEKASAEAAADGLASADRGRDGAASPQ